MVRYLIRLGYLGTKYRGIQIIPEYENETIQGVVEEAFSSLKLKNVPASHFASRTDKGVHAIMNAFHIDLEHAIPGEVYQPNQLRMKLNNYLTKGNHDIVITNVSVVPDTFHARFHARWRSYCYRVAILKHGLKIPINSSFHEGYLPPTEINRCHLVSSHLDTSIVKHVADLYCGKHDFSTFTKGLKREPWKNPNRVIDECRFYETTYTGCVRDPLYSNISMWEFYIQSSAFLYHQVRKLVSTAIYAGFGIVSLSSVKAMLDNPNPDLFRTRLTPPGGLYLLHIHYNPEDFNASSIEQREMVDNEEDVESEESNDNKERKCDLL